MRKIFLHLCCKFEGKNGNKNKSKKNNKKFDLKPSKKSASAVFWKWEERISLKMEDFCF